MRCFRNRVPGTLVWMLLAFAAYANAAEDGSDDPGSTTRLSVGTLRATVTYAAALTDPKQFGVSADDISDAMPDSYTRALLAGSFGILFILACSQGHDHEDF